MREVALIARINPGAVGYATTTVAEIQQIAVDVFGETFKALGVIHDGKTYPEHVKNVENCIALHEDDAKQLRDLLLKEMADNCHPLT